MHDHDNDFSIDSILKAAQGGQKPEERSASERVKPITPHPAHRAPHALTREEVLHVADGHAAHDARPDFDAIGGAHDFVVFEQDIDPDTMDAPAASTPTPAAPAPRVPGGSLYERMKQMRTAAPGTSAPAAKLEAEKPTTPVLSQSEPEVADEIAPQPESEKTPAPAKMAQPVPADEIPMTQVKARPRPASARHSVSLSVEELIASAERNAASNIKELYTDGSTPYNPDTYTPPAQPEEIKFAPIRRHMEPMAQPTTPNVQVEYRDISSGKTELPADEPTDVESFSSGVFSRQTLKVTPVKRSRVFVTPTDDGVTTPATKVVAQEIPVDIDVIDKSITAPTPDTRIIERNPYASQYSLADADLPGQGQLFPSSQDERVRELLEDREITPPDAPATGSTIQFKPVRTIDDDFDIDPTPPPAREDWEDDFEEDRRNKAGTFKLFGDDEAENPPEELFEDISEDLEAAMEESELTDYESVADAEYIFADLRSKTGRVFGRLVATGILTVLMFVLATPMGLALREANSVLFCAVNLLLLLLAAVINLPTMKGLLSLITLRPDTDSPAALAVLGTLAQSVYVCLAGNNALLLTALGGLALTFNLVGKLLMLSAVKHNFRMIADETLKKNLVVLDDPAVTTPLAGGSVLGEAFIIGNRKVTNATEFLRNSFRSDPYERHLPKVMLLTLLAAIGGGVIGAMTGGVEAAFRLCVTVLVLGCPITTAMLANLPMKLMSKRLNRLGAEVTGFAAAKKIGMANAMVLDAADLFPEGTVNLYNMHILSPHPIDRSILEAAAIALEAGSPLAPIFTGMIDHVTALPEVDTVKFEDKMGLSGWIGDKRIFIGNRTLMTAHNIEKLPSLDVDKRILQRGYFPIYLATTEGPCALFMVGYEADEEISYQLRRLTAEGVTLLINSCDQNLSEEMICDYFELAEDLVKVIPPQARKMYEQETAPTVSESSFAACKGDAAGLAAMLTASIRVERVYRIMFVLQILMMIGGFAAVLTAGSGSLLAGITALSIGAVQLVSGLITAIIALLYRP